MIRRTRNIKQVSDRKRDESVERERVVEAAFRRDNYRCVAEPLVRFIECGGRLDPHERIPRSVWPGGYLILDNVVSVCRQHHHWIDSHPSEAHAYGLHGFSTEVP